jgi:very-short-patch-repair endonuclease
MAAVLSCGPNALLSHESAAALWGLEDRETRIVVSIPRPAQLRRTDIRVHRVVLPTTDATFHEAVPCTTPSRTLIDLAARFSPSRAEAAVNAADKLGLLDPEQLRRDLETRRQLRGLPALRHLLDRDTFRLTDSELERRFLRLVASAGLPVPQTGVHLNGFKVDFFWPELGLVVEADGLRYHRTAAQQARDRRRDHAHLAAGLTTIRFTHAQIAHEPASVIATLRALARRLCA